MNVKWTNIVFVLRYGDETLHLWKPLLNTIPALSGSSEWFAQPGLEEILFLARPNNLIFKKDSLIPHQGIRLSS